MQKELGLQQKTYLHLKVQKSETCNGNNNKPRFKHNK